MTEIKCRIWSKKLNKVIQHYRIGELPDSCSNNAGIVGFSYGNVNGFQEKSAQDISANNVEIQLFSGLQDKDGLDIYEGDLLEYDHFGDNHIHVVIYSDGVFWLGDGKVVFLNEMNKECSVLPVI